MSENGGNGPGNGDDVEPQEELEEPINVNDVREDDELIQFLMNPRAKDLAKGIRDGDPRTELRAMLDAWVLDVRPETVVTDDTPADEEDNNK